MKIVKPQHEILTSFDYREMLCNIEAAGRTCYKSEEKITATSAASFVRRIIKGGHHSVIEHENLSVRFVCDRGVTHEIVRHRLAAYSQESTRYCNYSGSGIVLIHPPGLTDQQKERREKHFWTVQALYDQEISEGLSPQIARGVLPNALKTEIVMTANLREWRHVLKLRTSKAAHPQMRELMQPLLEELWSRLPVFFDDIGEEANP